MGTKVEVANDSMTVLRGTFEEKLEGLINQCCIENESDTPDFILAEYILGCLDNYTKAVRTRDRWFGFMPFGRSE